MNWCVMQIEYVEIIVECSKCPHTYYHMAEVTDVLAMVKDAICPLCGHDDSGQCIIEPGPEQLN